MTSSYNIRTIMHMRNTKIKIERGCTNGTNTPLQILLSPKNSFGLKKS